MRSGVRGAAPLLLALAACGGTGPSGGPPPLLTELPRPLTAAEQGIAGAANDFSFRLLRTVAAGDPAATVFLSPLSASMALGMTMNGAGGETLAQMRAALGFGTLPEPQVNEAYRGLIELLAGLDRTSEMAIANSIWARQGVPFVPAFLDAGRTWFDAEVRSVDFAAPATLSQVNGWVNAKTRGRIPVLLDQFDDDVVMLLLNAIYFHGKWREPYDPAQTTPGTFRGLRGDQTVPMMHRSGPAWIGSHQGHQVVEQLYGNGAFAMTIVLPREGTTLAALLAGLDASTWTALTGTLMEVSRADLVMPRINLAYRRAMAGDLVALGMTDAFAEARADFSRLVVPPPRLVITSVLQRAYLEINEAGTTAAAATAVQIGPTSAPQPVRIDRPFLLVLRERLTGTILFVGQVTEIPAA